MQKSSTRFLILSILIMAILVVIASSLILDFSKVFDNSEVNIAEAAVVSSSTTAPTAIGSVATRLNNASSVTYNGTTYTTAAGTLVKITNLSQLNSFLNSNSGKYGYIQPSSGTKITLTSAAMTSYTLSGVLDGNGYEIEINKNSGQTLTRNGYHGTLAGNLTGTFMNALFTITEVHYDFDGSDEKDKTDRIFYVGGVFGKITGGTVSNVSVVYNNANSTIVWANRGLRGNTNSGDITKEQYGQCIYAGILAGNVSGDATVYSTSINLSVDATIYYRHYGSWATTYPGVTFPFSGMFFGCISGNVSIFDSRILGSGKFIHQHGNGSVGYRYAYCGGVAGRRTSGKLTILGLAYEWSGGYQTTNCDIRGEGSFIGYGKSSSDDISGVYYKSNTFYTSEGTKYQENYISFLKYSLFLCNSIDFRIIWRLDYHK